MTVATVRSLTLCYHAISSSWEHPLAVGDRAFRDQLRWVERLGYRWAPLNEVVSGKRVAHVTFDDAYANVTAALPPLRAAGARATVFVPTALVGGVFTTPALSAVDERYRRVLDWSELAELVREGISVGSHSATHAHLTQLTDVELRRELNESRTAISDQIGIPCTSLAYPYGEHDDRVRRAAQRAGYELCFALRDGNGSATAIERVLVFRRDTGLRFVAKVSRFGSVVARARLRRLAVT